MINKIKNYFNDPDFGDIRRSELKLGVIVISTFTFMFLALSFLVNLELENRNEYRSQFKCPDGYVVTFQTFEPSCVPGVPAEKTPLQSN